MLDVGRWKCSHPIPGSSALCSAVKTLLHLLTYIVLIHAGIQNPEFEQKLAEAGFKVVHDQCLKVVHSGGHHSHL